MAGLNRYKPGKYEGAPCHANMQGFPLYEQSIEEVGTVSGGRPRTSGFFGRMSGDRPTLPCQQECTDA